MRIAFAGNPNSGKTTMYNVFMGQNEKTGNWAGVTVGKREAPFRTEFCDSEVLTATDLPGAYSMSPFTPEEGITSQHVREENPDVIINVVDSTNLSRSLFFTTQLLELGIPVVVALNKIDMAEKEGIAIDYRLLSQKLGCPVIATVSTDSSNRGLYDTVKAACECFGKGQTAPFVQDDINLLDKNEVDAADRKRYSFVNGIVAETEKREKESSETSISDKIDAVLTNRALGLVIFALVMWAVFAVSQTYVGPFIADYLVGWIETFQEWVAEKLASSPAVLTSLLADGIVGGVGAVIGFLPLVMVMFFLIALLEDCGYMARVSVIMDPIFKRVGLSGKSIIPVIIGTGCGVPAIMACRTIRDERERRATAMLATFIPCGAKIPVIALFAGAFFAGAGWVNTLMYFTGIVLILLGGLLVNAVTGHRFRKSFFIMELPEYKVPSLKKAFFSMLERAKAYIVKAATIILVCNCVVQLMQGYTWQFKPVSDNMADSSILASIASPFAVLFIPLGFGAWQFAAAAITGFIAKENVVGTLAVVFAITNFIDTEELVLMGGANEVALAMGLTSVSALAYLMFNLFTPPCFAAIGAMNSEMQSKGWLWSAIGLQLCTGYTVAFLVYQIGTLITEGHPGTGFVGGLAAVIVMIAAAVLIAKKIRKNFNMKYELHEKAGEMV